MIRTRPVVLLALATFGCTKPTSPDPGPSSTAASAAPTATSTPARRPSSAPSEPVPDPITHPCVVTSAQFDVAVAADDKSCKLDADCVCIPERIGSRHACAGIVSKKTIGKLRELEKEFQSMKCQSTHKCKQATCAPKCVSGTCQ